MFHLVTILECTRWNGASTIHIPYLYHTYLKDGYKMKQPLGCPDNVYAIMKKCWEYQVKFRLAGNTR